jgi:hypothetical protein
LSLRPLFRALTLSVFGVAGLGVGAAACGQDVASCGSVCPVGSASDDCPGNCMTIQASCDAANAGADFQALLTCVSNANGALTPLPELCAADYAIVSKNCGVSADGGVGSFVTDGGVDAGGA